jgi:hypothetical protein
MGFQISNVDANVPADDPRHPWPRLAAVPLYSSMPKPQPNPGRIEVELDPFSELQLKRTLALFAKEPNDHSEGSHAHEIMAKVARLCHIFLSHIATPVVVLTS